MSLFRSGTLERRGGGLEQLRTKYMKRPMVLTPEQERRRARVAKITPRPRYMDVLPRKGDWCIFQQPDSESDTTGWLEWLKPEGVKSPRVCFDTYQEATAFPGDQIPQGTGFDIQGNPRDIRCFAKHFMDPPSHWPQKYVIANVRECVQLLPARK